MKKQEIIRGKILLKASILNAFFVVILSNKNMLSYIIHRNTEGPIIGTQKNRILWVICQIETSKLFLFLENCEFEPFLLLVRTKWQGQLAVAHHLATLPLRHVHLQLETSPCDFHKTIDISRYSECSVLECCGSCLKLSLGALSG